MILFLDICDPDSTYLPRRITIQDILYLPKLLTKRVKFSDFQYPYYLHYSNIPGPLALFRWDWYAYAYYPLWFASGFKHDYLLRVDPSFLSFLSCCILVKRSNVHTLRTQIGTYWPRKVNALVSVLNKQGIVLASGMPLLSIWCIWCNHRTA